MNITWWCIFLKNDSITHFFFAFSMQGYIVCKYDLVFECISLKCLQLLSKRNGKSYFIFISIKRLLFSNNFESLFRWELEPKMFFFSNLLCLSFVATNNTYKKNLTYLTPKGTNLWWALKCHHLIILFSKQKLSDNSTIIWLR